MSAAPVDVLGWIGAHVAAHEALSESDAYHAQELPKAQAVRAAVAELIEAATGLERCFTENCKAPLLLRLRAALARCTGEGA